jgi:hypothetical protein
VEPKTIQDKNLIEIKIKHEPDNVVILAMNIQAAEELILEINKAIELLRNPQPSEGITNE